MFVMITSPRIKRKHNNFIINQFLLIIFRLFYIKKFFEAEIEKSFKKKILKIATSTILKVNIKISSTI